MAPCHYKSCTCWVRRGVTRAVLGVRRHSVSVCLSVFAIPTDKLSPNRQRLPQWPRGMEAAVRPLGDQDQHLGLLFAQFSWGKAGFFSGSSSCRGSLSFPPRGAAPHAAFPSLETNPHRPQPLPGVSGRVPPGAVGLWRGQEAPVPPPARPTPGQRQRAEVLWLPVPSPVSPARCHHPGVAGPGSPGRAVPWRTRTATWP